VDVFALLDDRDATAERPTSRRYTGFLREHRCVDPGTLDAVCAAVDADLAAGLHALLLADYEWGAKLLKAGYAALPAGDASALRVLMFRSLDRLSKDEAGDWLRGIDASEGEPCGTLDLEASVDRAEFTQCIERIHTAIAAGETYQVNYTYRLHGRAYGSPVALYRKLRARQPVPFGALIALPPGEPAEWVLSCSPELFLRHADGLLTARPMKGTASRHAPAEGDSETARLLADDTKNRAENLMIVDLLRNDLGRVAQTGSVKVPQLFAIEPYTTLFQMTSTVQALLRPEVGFAELLRAVFPCGSITGAPKHHTMELIAGLESTPRGLYCGAIGWLDAPQYRTREGARCGARCGDFCLSVAIRTITLGAPQAGLRPLALGIGAGIVQDSVAADEFDECRLKARFLTGLDPGFQLFETMLVMPGGGIRTLEPHLDRLERSARELGFGFDRRAARVLATERAATLVPGAAYRMRLVLAHDGQLALTHTPLQQIDDGEVALRIAPERVPDVQPLAAHKTTLRALYDAGVRAAEAAGAFDSLFFTHSGRLADGGRSSVFVRLGGRWWTPPLADGALRGVMRAQLLADPAWAAAERGLMLADLRAAEAIVVCNALRGVLPARLHHPVEVA
jgi:para-aminobenzoate synthetase/4-amino-4-deoxychorismate lyase